MDLLIPGFGLFFWTALAFLTVLFLLKKFAWKPILDAINEREEGIKNALQKITIEFKKVEDAFHIFLNGNDVEQEIRQPRVAALVSEVAAMSNVRKKLVEQQKLMAMQKGVVMEGRDIGSVVMPNAALKFFMTADIDVRTKRRQDELLVKTGKLFPLDELKANLIHR